MNRIWGIPLAALVLVATAACAAGNDETDRVAKELTAAISTPPQDSAAGYARAALKPGEAAPVTFLEITDRPTTRPGDADMHLVFRIHFDSVESGWTRSAAVTACYEANFNYRGLVSESRVGCPPDARPVTPPPAAPVEVPSTFDGPLAKALAALPDRPTVDQVNDAINRGVPRVQPDPETHAVGPTPFRDVLVSGDKVAVSFMTYGRAEGVDCLFGSRNGKDVLVWRPSWVEVQPGELVCEPRTALARAGTTPPH
ncbi:hypothetical protein VSH64_11340 [Amycolatopsis rhabdoformis]|uniref:DUF3558 domain-containing protein n=1 Tax=Amycolatopsis rhabdoformis TaxID=1448059 RepID=A0ABZ1IFZ0_9PSEU|nr:hypothetical protein [Amycolatopsis rhabdoformis]WSE32696.1 hypothetical protein VSH64_11340 [Amycolatopsis rhabdoformis]